MKAVDFLTTVWPTQGHYCIATPKKMAHGDGIYWVHKVFSDIPTACNYALANGQSTDMYFAVLSLREPFLVDQAKLEKQKAEGHRNPTGKTYRTHKNMAWARSFFLDLDVGKEYPDRATAIAALKEFLAKVPLPKPIVVSSGRGLHCYWPLTEDISSDEWKPQAQKLKRLCEYHDFKVDPTRIMDTASVLRVPGTNHLKNPFNPLPVRVAKEGRPASFVDICKTLDRSMQLTPTGEIVVVPPPDSIVHQTPVMLGQLAKACGQIDWTIRNAAAVSEPQWYKALGVVRFVDDGRRWSHEISKPYPLYDASETDKKLDQLERPLADGKQLGPTTCGAMANAYGEARCTECWFRKQVGWVETTSPLVAARRLPKKAIEGIPPPPAPYSRVKDGIMRGGDEPYLICPHDLYPVHAVADHVGQKRSSTWEIVLPRSGITRFNVTVEELNESRELANVLGNVGYMPQFEELKWVKPYMIAYLRELQKHCDEHTQHAHLGWTTDKQTFILPNIQINKGVSKPAIISENAARIGAPITKLGSFEKQKKLMEFYNDPKYLRHQFFIGLSLGAPLFYMTGHAGCVVVLSGESGASKSTALYSAASLWGHPERFTINGQKRGATALSLVNQYATLSNIPVCIDELTNMQPEDARDAIMNFTQPQAERGRMDRDGVARKRNLDGKSTLMLATSNNSLHELISFRNSSGTAGSMRLFEIPTPKVTFDIPEWDAKANADEYLRDLMENCGHIGPAFIEHITRGIGTFSQRIVDLTKYVDKVGAIRMHERFWSSTIAAGILGLRVAHELRLLPFDPRAVEAWVLGEQLDLMRGIVGASYASPVDTLLAYLASSANGLQVVSYGMNEQIIIKAGPRMEWVGRHDTTNKKITVFLAHFKAYAMRERLQLNELLRGLMMKGIISQSRQNPGEGTDLSHGQQPCLVIDLSHPAISGHPRISEVENVVPFTKRG